SLLAENLAYNSRYGLFTEDRVILEQLLGGILSVEEVEFVRISDKEDRLLVQKYRPGFKPVLEKMRLPGLAGKFQNAGAQVETWMTENNGAIYLISAPVIVQRDEAFQNTILPEIMEDKRLSGEKRPEAGFEGYVRIGLSPGGLNRQIRSIFLYGGVVMVLLSGGGIGLIYILSRHYVRPLEILAAMARKVEEGDLTQTAPVSGRDEIGSLAECFNRMTRSLSQRESQIRENADQMNLLNSKLANLNLTLEARVKTRTEDLEKAVLEVDAEKRKTEEIIQKITDGVMVAGMSGDLLLINEAAGRLLGLKDQSNLQNLQELGHIQGFISAFENPAVASVRELTIGDPRAKDSLILRMTVVPLKINEGTIAGSVAVFHDITRYKEVDRLKSEFVSLVSHELRTPLTSIKGYLDNMRDGIAGVLNDKQAEYLGRMSKNTERLVRLINDLLDISKIESGGMRLYPENISLRKLAEEVVKELRPMADEKGEELILSPADTEGNCIADRDKVEQVLINLLDNAIKFTPAGGKILVSVRNGENGYLVSVRDSGPGISPGERERIFERFYRAREGGDSPAKGSGLGLFIARSLVELHGGRLWMNSAGATGSEFSFFLPADCSRETAV
ncbi:MAG TPA: ATP-binding protein, partial [Nitrospiria bacterium]|nr:ATP-binding protein [Nitrospiria bacterium]